MASILQFPDATNLALASTEFDEPTRTPVTTAHTTTQHAHCPLCQQASSKVQSRDVRILADLPCLGQQVRWLVQVRRVLCLNEQEEHPGVAVMSKQR